jgi:ribosomal protein S18 acetylase RimI-like enzyme
MTKVSVRLANWSDAATFLELEATSFGMRRNPDTIYFWTPVVDHLWSYKAIADGKVVGGIIAMLTRRGNWYINSLFVHPTYRRRGVATKLLSRIIKLAGPREVLLDVKTDRKSLLEFYHRFGFEVKRRRKNYYRDGTDRYLLVRKPTT